MKKMRLGVCLAAVALTLTACSATNTTASTGSDANAQKPGYLAYADTSTASHGDLTVDLDYDSVEAGGLDPQTATTARSWSLMGLSYDTLVTVGPKFQIEPDLATSWTTPSDTEYVFTLRKGVMFSNGRPMTAADVVGSLQKLVASKSSWSLLLGSVASVEATGQDQVTVKLARPNSGFLAALANTPAAVLPIKEIDDGSVDITKTMLGTGPFVVQSHVENQSWTFVPNKHYWNKGKLGISKLTINIVPDETARLAALRNGTAQYVFFNNVDALNLLGGTQNARVVDQQNTDFYYLIINSQKKGSPLANQKVRFAINSAVNRQQISNIALDGKALPTGVTPVTLPGACKPSDLPSAKTSTSQIKHLLSEAGATNLKLTMTIYNSEPALVQIAQVIQQELAKVGVTLTIDNVDVGTYDSQFYSSSPAKPDLGLSWYAGYGDASMVSQWWNGDTATFTSGFMSNDRTLDALQVKATTLPNGSARTTTLKQLCDRVDQDSEMVPLVTRPSVIGYRTNKLSPTINENEGYGNILRYIVDFRLHNA